MLQCRDFWIFGYLGDPPSLSSPFSSLFHLLPSILFHSAQDAQEDLPMMPMRLLVLMLKPASFSDLSGRVYTWGCFFVGVTEISFKHYSLEPKNMQACQPQTQPSQCFNPEMSKLFKSPQLQWLRVFDCRPYSSHPSPQSHRARKTVFRAKIKQLFPGKLGHGLSS